jgi:SAM-dependent methyltransferase
MDPPAKPDGYFAGCNQALLRAVPPDALRILEVGCGKGRLGAALKALDPRRQVYGREQHPTAAAAAATHLDRVFALDAEAAEPPLRPGSLDCVLYGDVLEHLRDPEAVLRRHRRLLHPGGVALASVPNVGHHSVVADLLRGEFQYADAGLLDATHLRFFTGAALVKLFLDAGYTPGILDAIAVPCPPAFLTAARPLLEHLGVPPDRAARQLSAYQYVVRAVPLPDADGAESERDVPPLTFVVCVSDEARLRSNLLASPCLRDGSPQEVIALPGRPSAAEGLHEGLGRARNPVVVCVHQDGYLPRGWPVRFRRQYDLARQTLGPIGVAGVYGVSLDGGRVVGAGHVVDRGVLLREPPVLPRAVDTLDELLLAVPRDTPLRADPRLGFHFYGADLCLAAQERGLRAVALDAVCFHNSSLTGVPDSFHASARAFAAKWARRLPVATPCVTVEADGRAPIA